MVWQFPMLAIALRKFFCRKRINSLSSGWHFCVGVYCLRAMDAICHHEHVVMEAASRIKRGPQWAGVNCGPLSGRLTRPYTGWLVMNERQMNKRALEGVRTNPQKQDQ